jgi:hypothetical protein
MKQFLCACGCGEHGQVSKWWTPKKPLPRYLPHHSLRVHNKKRMDKTVGVNPPKISFLDRVTPEQIDYIRKHYHPEDRTHLAKEMGIPKLIFNFVCMELGLRREMGA